MKRLLRRYEATGFYNAETEKGAVFGWRMRGRILKLDIPYPSPQDSDVRLSSKGVQRTADQVRRTVDAETRRRWRAVVLYVKAQLEWAEAGVVDFDVAMLPFLLLPDGRTGEEWASSEVPAIYEEGRMPALPAWDGR